MLKTLNHMESMEIANNMLSKNVTLPSTFDSLMKLIKSKQVLQFPYLAVCRCP